MLLLKDIITFLEKKFPPSLADDWDNVGLQLGDQNASVAKVMVALDATTQVVEEAISQDVDLIITHHPFIFAPLKAIDFRASQGKNIHKLIKNDIALYAMHTNYDVAPGGMNDVLAEKIGLQNVLPFAMIDDVHGLGRIGELEQPMNIDSLSDIIKFEKLRDEVDDIKTVETVGAGCIKKVAVIGGSGGKYICDAKEAGADALVTGDVTYHIALDAIDIGLNLLDIGHFAEVVMQDAVCDLLVARFEEIDVMKSNTKSPII